MISFLSITIIVLHCVLLCTGEDEDEVLQSQPPSTPSLKEEAPSAVDTGIQFTH